MCIVWLQIFVSQKFRQNPHFLSKLIFVIFVINPHTTQVEQKFFQAQIPDEFDENFDRQKFGAIQYINEFVHCVHVQLYLFHWWGLWQRNQKNLL